MVWSDRLLWLVAECGVCVFCWRKKNNQTWIGLTVGLCSGKALHSTVEVDLNHTSPVIICSEVSDWPSPVSLSALSLWGWFQRDMALWGYFHRGLLFLFCCVHILICIYNLMNFDQAVFCIRRVINAYFSSLILPLFGSFKLGWHNVVTGECRIPMRLS